MVNLNISFDNLDKKPQSIFFLHPNCAVPPHPCPVKIFSFPNPIRPGDLDPCKFPGGMLSEIKIEFT